MAAGVTIAAVVVLAFPLSGLIVRVGMRRARRLWPGAVLAAIRRPGVAYAVRVGPGMRAWDPSQPVGVGNGMVGPGRATYRLDANGQVHLVFEKAGAPTQERVGALPADTFEWPFRSKVWISAVRTARSSARARPQQNNQEKGSAPNV